MHRPTIHRDFEEMQQPANGCGDGMHTPSGARMMRTVTVSGNIQPCGWMFWCVSCVLRSSARFPCLWTLPQIRRLKSGFPSTR
jgi:hypothetical protein